MRKGDNRGEKQGGGREKKKKIMMFTLTSLPVDCPNTNQLESGPLVPIIRTALIQKQQQQINQWVLTTVQLILFVTKVHGHKFEFSSLMTINHGHEARNQCLWPKIMGTGHEV